MSALDRPVWASLTGAHAHLALGAGPARRYRPEINHFLGWADDSPATLAAAAALVAPGEQVYAGQTDPIPDLPGLVAVVRRAGVRMLYAAGIPPADDAGELAELGAADSAEMLALARLTEPGPFETETWRMGRFFGVRRAGRLVAMAGQRLHPPGHVELSGVCTHPDCRGKGWRPGSRTTSPGLFWSMAKRPFCTRGPTTPGPSRFTKGSATASAEKCAWRCSSAPKVNARPRIRLTFVPLAPTWPPSKRLAA